MKISKVCLNPQLDLYTCQYCPMEKINYQNLEFLTLNTAFSDRKNTKTKPHVSLQRHWLYFLQTCTCKLLEKQYIPTSAQDKWRSQLMHNNCFKHLSHTISSTDPLKMHRVHNPCSIRQHLYQYTCWQDPHPCNHTPLHVFPLNSICIVSNRQDEKPAYKPSQCFVSIPPSDLFPSGNATLGVGGDGNSMRWGEQRPVGGREEHDPIFLQLIQPRMSKCRWISHLKPTIPAPRTARTEWASRHEAKYTHR